MSRFSKAQVFDLLRERAARAQDEHKFDPRNGTAQLSDRTDDATQRLIDRAVAYGRWRALQEIESSIDDLWPT